MLRRAFFGKRWVSSCATWIGAVVVFAGCTQAPRMEDPSSPTPATDFVDDTYSDPITVDSVSETMMLHRRFRVMPYGGVFLPTSDFDPGPMAGVKASVETVKNVFWGLSFDWGAQDIETPVSSLSSSDLAKTSPAQWFKSIERWNMLINLEYEWLVEKDFLVEKAPLSLELGLGLGASMITNEEDPLIKEAGTDIETYVGFLMRPQVDLLWEFERNFGVFLGVGYDFIYPDRIDVRVGGQDRTVSDGIWFNTFYFRLGLVVDF